MPSDDDVPMMINPVHGMSAVAPSGAPPPKPAKPSKLKKPTKKPEDVFNSPEAPLKRLPPAPPLPADSADSAQQVQVAAAEGQQDAPKPAKRSSVTVSSEAEEKMMGILADMDEEVEEHISIIEDLENELADEKGKSKQLEVENAKLRESLVGTSFIDSLALPLFLVSGLFSVI